MIINRVKGYGATNPEKLDVQIFLKYFNTASSKCLYDLLDTLKVMRGNGTSVSILWNYVDGDEEMKEEIEDFQDAVGLDFSIESVEDNMV
jgi:hypothetical protein